MLSTDLFRHFERWSGDPIDGFDVNFLGQRADITFADSVADAKRKNDCLYRRPYLGHPSETSEMLMLLAAVLEAKGCFVMIEAGAGYGRWLVSAACALRQRRPTIPCRLIGVEAEPQHFEWMLKHFRDNDLDPSQHELVHGAVSTADGTANFLAYGDPARWYGQALPSHVGYDETALPPEQMIAVPTFCLRTLLADVDRVDLADFDIQGSEGEVIPAEIDVMNAKVRRAFVATHYTVPENRTVIDEKLFTVFSDNGWQCVAHEEPGADDGAQCWLNPRLV
jgi:FkbM family methyltransferase